VENLVIPSTPIKIFSLEGNALKNVRAFINHQLHDEFRGFYQLYQIERSKQNCEPSESDRENDTGGLKSPYGQRGSILSNFGWTWKYLHWDIKWAIVQRMLIDAPSYSNSSKKDSEGNYIEKIQAEQDDWEKMLKNVPVTKKQK
jgi:hypothetical protein